jgi:voltage-gated potassium channel
VSTPSPEHGSRPAESRPIESGRTESRPAPSRLTQEQWQRLAEWPLVVMAVAFVIAYAWTVLGDIPDDKDQIQEVVMWGAWAMFAIDYIVNLVLTSRRWHWFWTHLLDLAIVVLPALRPLRLLRLFALVRVFHRFAGSAFRGRVLLYVFSYGTVLVFMAALAVLDAEQNAPHSQIRSFGEALWWACVTITTVGYGDVVPVTLIGRLVGVALMFCGIGIVGTVAATLSSWFVQTVGERQDREQRVTAQHIDDLRHEIIELKQTLQGRAPGSSPASSPAPSPAAALVPHAASSLISTELTDQLRSLASLRDEGILTDAEFAAKKAQVLGV